MNHISLPHNLMIIFEKISKTGPKKHWDNMNMQNSYNIKDKFHFIWFVECISDQINAIYCHTHRSQKWNKKIKIPKMNS